MIYEKMPDDFNPRFEVVSCICEHDDKILLLLRQDHKLQGNTWGLPTGKVDRGEDVTSAITRELKEETGINIRKDKLLYVKQMFVHHDDYDFIFHLYHSSITHDSVTINPKEHKEYCFVTPEKALTMNYIADLDFCLKVVYNLS